MRLRLSFQGRVLGGCFLVVLCTLVLVAVVLPGLLREQMVAGARRVMAQELALVKEVVGQRWRPEMSLAQVDRLADRLGQRLKLRVTLISPQGVVLGDSRVPLERLPRLENHADRPEVIQALAQGRGSSVRRSATLGVDLLYVAGLLGRPGRPRLVVRLALPLAEMERALAQTRRLILWALSLGLVLSVGVAYLVARGISRPVRELTRTVQAIAQGDLSQRVRRYPAHELGELARAFDRMADSLQSQIAAVTQARDRLAAVLRGMAEGVLVLDHQGRVLLANRALRRMLALPGDPTGRRPAEIIRNPQLLEALEAARQGEESHLVRQIRTLEPPRRHLEVVVVRLPADQEEAGLVVVLHDITELKRTEQVRRDFVANVSHELRTPLAAIRGAVETLQDGALDDPAHARRFLETVERQVVRLQAIVQDLLDLAAIESGQRPPRFEAVDAGRVLAGAAAAAGELARRREVELHTAPPPRPLLVRADRRHLEQAVANLVDNALKYTEPGGRVTLSLEERGDEVALVVSDTGVGIPPQDLERIFERFYRVDKGRSRRLGGTGLGLAIVKHLVRAMQGRVEVASQPGQGSTFRVILPRWREENFGG